MNDVPPTPSKSRSRKNRTPVPLQALDLLTDPDSTPFGDRSTPPTLPALNFCSNHNHGLALPVLHGAIGPGGGGGASRPTLLERRNRTGMSMSCLSGLSMDTIHETSRENGAQQVSSDQVPPATFRGWSTDTPDAVLLARQSATTSPPTLTKGARRASPSTLTGITASTASSTMKGAKEEKRPASASGGFSLVSYNILAARLVTTDRYPDCPPTALGEDYRLKLIREELDLAGADIVALQEISVEVFEEDDSLGGFLRNERDYDGEFAVITSKSGTDRCDVRRPPRSEKALGSKATPTAGDAVPHLSALMFPTLSLSRRESRNGSSATATVSDDPGTNQSTPLYCERSPAAREKDASDASNLVAHPPAVITRQPGGGRRSPLNRTGAGIPVNATVPKAVTSKSAAQTPALEGDVATGHTAAAPAGRPLSPMTVQVTQQPRRTEMDGLAIFWKKSRFELVELQCVRFNDIAANDTTLTPYERKKLQVDSHNVALLCALRDVTNPRHIIIVATVHLIWQRVEAQLWQANELVKAIEGLKSKYQRQPSQTRTVRHPSPFKGSPPLSQCSRSMPVTLSAPAPQPLPPCKAASGHLRQSDSNFSPRRETSSASVNRSALPSSPLAEPPQTTSVTCLITGDFNADPTNPVMPFMTTGHIPDKAQTMTQWRRLSMESTSPTALSEEEGATISSVVPALDRRASSDFFVRTGFDDGPHFAANTMPLEQARHNSESLSTPAPPCKNWSRKRTANPMPSVTSDLEGGAAAMPLRTSGPMTPPRDGRNDAYRGRRLDADALGNSADEPRRATTDTFAREEETALTTRGFPSFDDLHGMASKCVEVMPVADGSFSDQVEADRFGASKALSELSVGADVKHSLFVPCLSAANRSGADSLTTTSVKTANATPIAVPPAVLTRPTRTPSAGRPNNAMASSEVDSFAARGLSSRTSSQPYPEADAWLCECSPTNTEREHLAANMTPLSAPFNLPQSKHVPMKPQAQPRLVSSPGTADIKDDTAPTHSLQLKDAYEVYRARNPKLVSAVNPSTNAEGKVLDHIFYESDCVLCERVVKLGELVDLPNTFFPSDHYMVGAAFVSR